VKANYRKILGQIIAGSIALLAVALTNQATAQFTGDNQTNIINGTAVNWPGLYYVGSNSVSDTLLILNGGFLYSSGARIGSSSNANNNLAVVSGSGSVWTNYSDFYVGLLGSANRLEIRNGGVVQVQALNTVVGSLTNSQYNSVLVTDTGSVWTIQQGLFMGDGGSYCSLVISNGGAVLSQKGEVGGNNGGQTNTAIVTGHGSVWSNSTMMFVGNIGKGNMLIVSNGAAVFSTRGYIGFTARAQSNSVLVTGTDSLWKNSGDLFVGFGQQPPFTLSTDGNSLTVANGGSVVVTSNAYLGFTQIASNSLLNVSGGILTVTNLSGTGTIDVRRGRLAFNSGTITADRLWLTNGIDSILEFNSGTLHSGGTVVSNTQPCVVGDAVGSGNFHLVGGVHSFQNGLRIRTNSFLTGCGTVNGSVVIDAGGAVHANCTNLVFSSGVTNNGAMVVDGAVLETFGTFVNNGKIFLLNGGTTNLHGTFLNNGAILSDKLSLTIARDGSSGFFVRYTGAPDITYRLLRAASLTGPWSDVATNTTPASGFVEHHETAPLPVQGFYRTIRP
jgi:T5SS/PEP-CTERM-associated repeat protein